MLDLKGYLPLETFYRFRFSWKCAVIRMTTGEHPLDTIKLVNCPCFIQSFRGEILVTDFTLLQDIAQTFNVYIPAKFVGPRKEFIQLERRPDGHIWNGDYLVVTEFPYLLHVISIRDPLFHHRHYEITATILPDRAFGYTIESHEDMTEKVKEIVTDLFASVGIPSQFNRLS